MHVFILGTGVDGMSIGVAGLLALVLEGMLQAVGGGELCLKAIPGGVVL